MRVLNLLTSGSIGGIESLCRDIGLYSDYDNGYCFLFQDGVIYDQMKAKGLKTYCLKDEKRKLSRERLRKLTEIAEDYDVIVVHHGDLFLKLYYYLLIKKFDKKFVTVVHSCYEDKYFHPSSKIKKYVARSIFQVSMSKSDRIIFVSEAGKRSYEQAFRLPEGKSTVVYNGVGMDKLEAGRNTPVSKPEEYNVTYIGRLDRVKGIDLLIDAVGMLAEKYPIRLSIVGDGKIREELQKQVGSLGLGEVVTFYGKQADVIPFLRQADIFVYPSVWQEVFGISVVEAMAFGKLCVANRVGGLPEIIEDGVNGFLTEVASASGIAATLERAVQSYQDGSFLAVSKEAKKTAERFSIQHTIEHLTEIYQSL